MKPFRDITHDGCQFHIFDDMASYLEHINPERMRKLTANNHWSASMLRKSMNCSKEWCGGLDFEGSHKLATEGQPMEPEALEIRDQLTTASEVLREQAFAWDVTGETVDMGAYMSGEPECMLTTQEQEVQAKKVINIVYYQDASGGVAANRLKMQGIAMLALVDAVMNTGHYVLNLWLASANTGSYDGKARGCVLIKLADQARQYDPQSIGYALANPGMLRQMMFAYWLQLPLDEANHWYGASMGLGYPCECSSFPAELEIDMEATITGEAWLLGKKDSDRIHDKASAMEWVQERMNMIATQQ